MKRPFDTVREAIFELMQNHKQHSKELIEQIDKLLLWVVGFSIGGLSLIVSNLATFSKGFNYGILKSILILLSISIISGIVFRIACYFIQIYNNQINVYIESVYSDKEFMEIEPEDLTSETNINEVLRRLQVDFGEDASKILSAYSSVDLSNATNYNYLLNDLKEHYKKIGEWAKRDYEIAIEFAKDTMQKAYGYSAKQIDRIIDDNTSAKWQIGVKVAYFSFLVSCITFISVIVILCVTY